MDTRKVIYELGERTADPFESKYCMKLIESIEDDKNRMGKILVQLLTNAENGVYK